MSGAPRTPRAEFSERLDAVETRLKALAASEPAPGLTEPDPQSGERWDWGQVWAHLAEFIPYWIGEVGKILAAVDPGPIPFGRTKADPDRVAAIERDRNVPSLELMARLGGHIAQLRALIREMTAEDWSRTGAHLTLGEIAMPAIFQDFLVGHLEAHAGQLDGLAEGTTPS